MRVDNPHQVTKGQLGLGSVENYGIASTGEAQTGVANNKYVTPHWLKLMVNNTVTVVIIRTT